MSAEALAKARGKAKHDLIAQAAVVAREFRLAGERCEEHVKRLKNKEIDEWAMVEAIHEEVFGALAEVALTQLAAKLVTYQITDLEYRRVLRGEVAA